MVALAGLLLGGLTSFGQGLLPGSLSSFANSASGWTCSTAVLVWAVRRGTVLSAVLGAVSFVALTVGYALVSTARGFFDDTLPWSLIGLIVGPFIGVAAAWLHQRGTHLALGAGLLAGIGIGDGIDGLTVDVDTTSPVYWTAAVVVGTALAVTAAIRTRLARRIPLEAALLTVTAVLLNVTYRLL